jgi:hypothetical protein
MDGVGSHRHAQSAIEEIQRRGQGDAHGQEDEMGTLNGRRYPLLSSESTKSVALLAGLQREITMAWWRTKRGERRGRKRGSWGLSRRSRGRV